MLEDFYVFSPISLHTSPYLFWSILSLAEFVSNIFFASVINDVESGNLLQVIRGSWDRRDIKGAISMMEKMSDCHVSSLWSTVRKLSPLMRKLQYACYTCKLTSQTVLFLNGKSSGPCRCNQHSDRENWYSNFGCFYMSFTTPCRTSWEWYGSVSSSIPSFKQTVPCFPSENRDMFSLFSSFYRTNFCTFVEKQISWKT